MCVYFVADQLSTVKASEAYFQLNMLRICKREQAADMVYLSGLYSFALVYSSASFFPLLQQKTKFSERSKNVRIQSGFANLHCVVVPPLFISQRARKLGLSCRGSFENGVCHMTILGAWGGVIQPEADKRLSIYFINSILPVFSAWGANVLGKCPVHVVVFCFYCFMQKW